MAAIASSDSCPKTEARARGQVRPIRWCVYDSSRAVSLMAEEYCTSGEISTYPAVALCC